MKLIEKHIIKKSHPSYQEIDRLCFLSKNLFNAVNYIVRQKFIQEQKYLNYAATYHLVKDSVDYKAIPSKVSCQIIKLVDRCWSSFFSAIKEYTKSTEKFKGRPNLPKYKDKIKGRCVVIYPSQAISKRGLKKGLLQPSATNISIPTAITAKVDEIRLVPRCSYYVLEAVYEIPVAEYRYFGIKVIVTEESYTSKASFLDLDFLPGYHKNAKQKYTFSGKRIRRGLYRSGNGTLINADLNGSYNILRKAVPNAFAEGIEGLGVIPFRVTPGKVTL